MAEDTAIVINHGSHLCITDHISTTFDFQHEPNDVSLNYEIIGNYVFSITDKCKTFVDEYQIKKLTHGENQN